MKIFNDIKGMIEGSAIFIFLDSFFLFSLGLATLILFRADIFFNLDLLKGILIAISIPAPFLFANMLILLHLSSKQGLQVLDDKSSMFTIFTIALIVTNILFYPVLIVSYLLNLIFRNFLIALIVLEVIVALKMLLKGKKIITLTPREQSGY